VNQAGIPSDACLFFILIFRIFVVKAFSMILHHRYIIVAGCFLLAASLHGQTRNWLPKVTPGGKNFVNTRIDNIGYWNKMISLGYVEANPYVITESAVHS